MIPSTSTGELKRRMLYQAAKGNPQVVMFALDEIKGLAKSSLEATLSSAKPEVIRKLQKEIDIIFEKMKGDVKEQLQVISKKFLEDSAAKLDKMVSDGFTKNKAMFKGDKGDRPAEQELRDLIKLLTPAPVPGKTPSKEEIMAMCKPLLAEMFNLANANPMAKAEADKKFNDAVEAAAIKAVGDKIGQVKRFGGGGFGGDKVKAGSGITITLDTLGRKVISAAGSAGITFVTPTGTVNGSNAAFTVASTPTFVVADGIMYFSGAGYSYLAGTITMDVAPSQYIRAVL